MRRRMEVDLDILAGLAQPGRVDSGVAAVPAAGHGGRVPPRGPPRAGLRPRGPQPAAVLAELFSLAARAHSANVSRPVAPRACSRWNGSTAPKLSDPAVKQIPDIDLSQVARHGAEMYLDMIFQHGFYHGDPHPGNLIVLPSGAIGLLDFGMVARLDESLREDIEDMLIAIVTQDAQRLTTLVMRLGAVPPGLDEAALGSRPHRVRRALRQSAGRRVRSGRRTDRNDRNHSAVSHRPAARRWRCSSKCW